MTRNRLEIRTIIICAPFDIVACCKVTEFFKATAITQNVYRQPSSIVPTCA